MSSPASADIWQRPQLLHTNCWAIMPQMELAVGLSHSALHPSTGSPPATGMCGHQVCVGRGRSGVPAARWVPTKCPAGVWLSPRRGWLPAVPVGKANRAHGKATPVPVGAVGCGGDTQGQQRDRVGLSRPSEGTAQETLTCGCRCCGASGAG